MKTRVGHLVRWLVVERELQASMDDANALVIAAEDALALAEVELAQELEAVTAAHRPRLDHLRRARARALAAFDKLQEQEAEIDASVRGAWKNALLHSELRLPELTGQPRKDR